MTKSIAVFGVNRIYGSAIAKKLAEHSFRLLLLTEDKEECSFLISDFPNADIQILNCPAQSGWEADIIVLDVAAEDKPELTDSIRSFVTQKIVFNISEPEESSYSYDETDIKFLLPYSRIVNLGFIKNKEEELMFFISGKDKEALDEAKILLKQIGFIHAPVDLLVTNKL